MKGVFGGSVLRAESGGRRCATTLLICVAFAFCLRAPAWGQGTLPVVAIHDSELTRNLETVPAAGLTPTGPGTTGKQWWPVDWHYFVMPESVQEALRSDGTAFTVVRDADIAAGLLLPDGSPKYPILISLASEAIADNEIGPLTNYVAAGGYLLVGSSAFTRNPDGTSRSNFAFAHELGIHMASSSLQNWGTNNLLRKQIDHRLANHIPSGQLTWRMPSGADEISWGTSPIHPFLAPHDLWQVNTDDATIIALGDTHPFLLVKPFGKGYFIYCAAFQPLVGHGAFAPGMYAYVIFRRAIEWAFESSNLPVPKLSPWPYPYDAALIVRHDLENYSQAIAGIEASAQVEYTNGVKGDYYFCTGTLREEMAALGYRTNAVIASLQRAAANYGATIAPHNGGLKNPNNPALVLGNYDYWHWGPDEALDVTPSGYLSGKAYAQTSLANSFADFESWLPGQTGGLRLWVSSYFNATREDSYDIEAQLGVNIAGEQKLSPFPHWTLSTQTSGKRYPFLSEPVSDWFVGGLVAQSLEPWYPPGVHTCATLHQAIDYYYRLGALLNFYDHTLATGEGDAGPLALDYITYSMNGSLHPRLWPANAIGVYQWWRQRANAQITASYATGSGDQALASLSIEGATDPNTAVEFVLPGGALSEPAVTTNGVVADGASYRLTGQTLKVWVGTAVSSVGVSYVLGPQAREDFYFVSGDTVLTVPGPGVLSNDQTGASQGPLAALLVSNPVHGTLALNPDGSFSYSPSSGYVGLDRFSYAVNDGVLTSSPTAVSLLVGPYGSLFYDDFTRPTDPSPPAPWLVASGSWNVSGGALRGGPDPLQTYGYAYIENWTDYAVEGKIQFPSGAFGGGIGGRLDAATGAHYAAWVYPEEAGTPAVLRLVKFQTWEDWGYNGSVVPIPMQEKTLPNVGSDWHTLKLAFAGSQIAVYYDGDRAMSLADQEAQPYLSGGVSVDMWTWASPYTMVLDKIGVYPLALPSRFALTANQTLSIPAPGVLANATAVYGTSLTAVVESAPAHGTLVLTNDGGFSYTPTAGFSGSDSFTYQALDGGRVLATAIVSISINGPPVGTAGVSGRVVQDLKADGGLGNDPGLSGWTVTLKDSAGTIVATALTDATGAYSFVNLAAGSYTVVVTPQANFQQTYDPNGKKDNQTVLKLAAGQKAKGDFAYTGTAPGISLTQTGPTVAKPGDTITFTFTATNTGNAAFAGALKVCDPLLGGKIFSHPNVTPGEGFVFSAKHVVKTTDPASLVSLATATADTRNGNPVTAQATWTVTVLAAPSGLVPTPGNGLVTLKWNAVSGAAACNVKRSIVKSGPYTTLQAGLATTNCTDETAVNGTPYYYVVSATKAGVEGPNSAPACAIPSAGLPSPWSTSSIGTVALAGGASYSDPTFSVIGSGKDIGDKTDQFRYVYQIASGDCTIVARVVTVQNSYPEAKAGVMIRESLSAGSVHASTFVTPGKVLAFQYRTTNGKNSQNRRITRLTAPHWVRVMRNGNTFTSSRSADGVNWTVIGAQTVKMAPNVYIGLAVTSHDNCTLCTAIFDNVTAAP